MSGDIFAAIALVLLGMVCIGIVILRQIKRLSADVKRMQHDGLSRIEQRLESTRGHLADESAQIRSVLSKVTDETLPQIAQETRNALSLISVITELSPQFDSPVTRLTFEESLNPTSFAEAAESAAKSALSNLLERHGGDGFQFALQSVRLTQQGPEMIVSVSARGQTLLKKGVVTYPIHKLSGVRIPQIVDARTGQVVEKLKEIPVANITSKLATVSGAVVSAAHLIAGADLAKRMVQVESKLDRLLALHRVDQIAKLERIYISAQELAYQEMDKNRKFEMWRLRGELRELRSAWRQECSLKLSQIDDPQNYGWFKQLFSRQRTIDRRIVVDITSGEADVALMHYSMCLEHVLAIGSGTIEEFIHSQESEIEQLDALSRLLQETSSYISGKYSDLSVDLVVAAVSNLVATCREILPLPAPVAKTEVRPTIRSTPTGHERPAG